MRVDQVADEDEGDGDDEAVEVAGADEDDMKGSAAGLLKLADAAREGRMDE